MSYIDDLQKTQAISEDVVKQLREMKEQFKITTGKMRAIVHEEMANKIAYLENKDAQIDHAVKVQNGVLDRIRRALRLSKKPES